MPEIQLVNSFHSAPEPTAPGMRSEASKRTAVAFWMVLPTKAEITSVAVPGGSASFCGAMAPPAAIQDLRCSPLVKYSITAMTSGRSLNAAQMSPATRTGLPYCGSRPGR